MSILVLCFVATPGLSGTQEQAFAEWARPIRVDTSSEATRLYQAARDDFVAGRLNEAARNLEELLGLDRARVDIDGRSVDAETAVAGWLARLEAQGDGRLRRTLSGRSGGTGVERRWFDPIATRNAAQEIAVLLDAGQPARAALIAGSYTPLGEAVRAALPAAIRSTIPPASTSPELDLSGVGWTVSLLPRIEPLSRDTLVSLRSFGVAPRLAASPVIQGGRVFARNWDMLECFHEATGERIWAAHFGQADAITEAPRDVAARIPRDDQVSARLTTSLLGPVSVHSHQLFAVTAGKSESVSLTSASARRALGIECRDTRSGRLIWSHVDDGVPLAAPITVNGEGWYPVRFGKRLGLARINLHSGETLERFAAAELADRGSRQIASLYRAAFRQDGPRLLVGYDEGLAACFDVLRRRWLWLRPLGLDNSDEQVRELPDDADVTGGPYAMLPRVRNSIPRVELSQDGERARLGCPGWTDDLVVRIADGAPAVNDVAASEELLLDQWGVSLTGSGREHRVTPHASVSPNLIGPSPFSIGRSGHVFLQTETHLTRLSKLDFKPTRDSRAGGVWLALNCLTRLSESPIGFLARLGVFDKWINVEPLIVDRGLVAVALRKPTAETKYTLDSRRPANRWAAQARVDVVDRRRNRFLDAYDSLPIQRLADGAPLVAVSLNRMNRRSIRIRINGVPAGEIALPGRDGDDRLHPLITRGWQLDSVIVLQLGRELFGLKLARRDDAANETSTGDPQHAGPAWTARIAWPSDGGFRIGPARRGLVPVSRYVDFETAVGPLLMSEDGRVTGSVAVTPSQVVIAREGSFLFLDPNTGELIGHHFGRGPDEIVLSRGDQIFAVDLVRKRIMSLEAGVVAERQSLPNCAGKLLRLDSSGVWGFDAKGKQLSWASWKDDDLRSFPMKRPELVAFCRTSAAAWDASRNSLLIWREGADTAEMIVDDAGDVVRVLLIETPDTLLVGLSKQVNDPGLVDRLQSLSGKRVLFAGRLFAFDSTANTMGLTPMWQSELEPCALLMDQPPDAPVLIGEWNAKYALPNGSLSSLHVGHVRMWDRRSGELLVDERSNAPQRPVVTVDRSQQLVRAQLGEKEARIEFVNP